jgi:hypothetical protein
MIKPLTLRPWLSPSMYNLLARETVLHLDLYAYRDALGSPWFRVIATQGGTRHLGQTWYAMSQTGLIDANHLMPADVLRGERSPLMHPLSWSRADGVLFSAVHPLLLAECARVDGYSAKTIHCHYVPVHDRPALNADVVNTYVDTPARGRPKRAALPDIL